MSTAFAPTGSYTLKLGDSFLSPESSNGLYTLRFNNKPDASLKSRPAILHNDHESCLAEWPATEDYPEAMYEGVSGNVQDIDCLLVFDEKTKTFVLERQSHRLTMKKSAKRKALTQGKRPATSPLADPPMDPTPLSEITAPATLAVPASTTSASSPIPIQRKERMTKTEAAPTTQKPTVPHMTLALPGNGQPSKVDEFDDLDLLKDMDEIMDEILGDDDDDDNDEDEDEDEESFEDITPSTVHASPATPARPSAPVLTPVMTASPGAATAAVSPAKPSPGNKRRKLQMASAPIRRPSPPRVPAPPKPIPSTSTTSTSDSEGESGTSSGSSGSGSSSSGSESESSSDSESDDDDMEELEKDIILSMSSDEPPTSLSPRPIPPTLPDAPPSATAYKQSPLAGRASTGPMSLRALYKDGDEEEEDEGSSSSSDGEIA